MVLGMTLFWGSVPVTVTVTDRGVDSLFQRPRELWVCFLLSTKNSNNLRFNFTRKYFNTLLEPNEVGFVVECLPKYKTLGNYDFSSCRL